MKVVCERPLSTEPWLLHTGFLCPRKGHRTSSGKGPPVLKYQLLSFAFLPLKNMSECFHFFPVLFSKCCWAFTKGQIWCCALGMRKEITVYCWLADVLVLDWILRLGYWSVRAWQGDKEFKISQTPSTSGPAWCLTLTPSQNLNLAFGFAMMISAWQCSRLFHSAQIYGAAIACQALCLVLEDKIGDNLEDEFVFGELIFY